jgi:hypothetical protein
METIPVKEKKKARLRLLGLLSLGKTQVPVITSINKGTACQRRE